MQAIYAGVDVSKNKFDVSVIKGNRDFVDHISFKNNLTGFKQLRKYLLKNFKDHSIYIAMESTGSYSQGLSEFSYQNGYHTYVLNPVGIKNFAKGMLCHAKTDKLDSGVISEFLIFNHKKLITFQPLSESQSALKACTNRRTDIMVQRLREKNRVEALQSQNPFVLKSLKRSIKFLEKELKEIENEMKRIVENDSIMKEQKERLSEIKGIGDISIYTALSMIPELGMIRRKQIAALVGVAPYVNESGNMTKKGHIKKGRQKVKSVLHMAASVAIRHNKKLEKFYEKLKESGKPYKVAITAVMRKLLIAMNGIMRTYFREKLGVSKNQPLDPKLCLTLRQ